MVICIRCPIVLYWRPHHLLVLTLLTSDQTFKGFISNPPQPRDCDAALHLANHTRVPQPRVYGRGATSAPPTSSSGSSWKRSKGEGNGASTARSHGVTGHRGYAWQVPGNLAGGQGGWLIEPGRGRRGALALSQLNRSPWRLKLCRLHRARR